VATPSPTPRRLKTPSWFDLRLVAGVMLVLISVAGGALVVAGADSTHPVWAVRSSLAAGTVITQDDLQAVKVRLSDRSRYLPAGSKRPADDPVNKTLSRRVAAGELLPRSAIAATPAGTTLTVPLTSDQAPRITRGQEIELWLSSKACRAVVVLPGVTVQDVQSTGGGSFGTSSTENLVIRVPRDQATRVITALGLEATTIRAGLLDGDPDPATVLPDLEHCAAGS
jgi:SAF domain